MRYFRSAAFNRLYRKLPAERRQAADKALANLDLVFQRGSPIPGLGLKELRRGVWEIRAGLLDRIVFSRSKDVIELLAIGTHDDIKRFLRRS